MGDDVDEHLLARHAAPVAVGEDKRQRFGQQVRSERFEIVQIPLIRSHYRGAKLSQGWRVGRIVSREAMVSPGGTIPPHDGSGPIHVCFAVNTEDLPEWEARLAEHDIPIEGRVTWPPGGKSVYFRDPDGHMLELMTPGTWRIY